MERLVSSLCLGRVSLSHLGVLPLVWTGRVMKKFGIVE